MKYEIRQVNEEKVLMWKVSGKVFEKTSGGTERKLLLSMLGAHPVEGNYAKGSLGK